MDNIQYVDSYLRNDMPNKQIFVFRNKNGTFERYYDLLTNDFLPMFGYVK